MSESDKAIYSGFWLGPNQTIIKADDETQAKAIALRYFGGEVEIEESTISPLGRDVVRMAGEGLSKSTWTRNDK